jgi:hypothetical protein
LTKIHSEHLEFTSGSVWEKYIIRVADSWYFAEKGDEEAVAVEVVFWLNYRDIIFVRWETDDYWEWPQICCRFTSSNKYPLSRIFYAERKTGLPRPFYHEVCPFKDVTHRPPGLTG